MAKNEKGAISGIALGIFLVILVAIIGIGWMWKKGGVVATNTGTQTSTSTGIPNTGETGYSYVIGESSTSTVARNTVTEEPKTVTRTYTTYVKKTVPNTQASAYSGYSGSNVYHNGTYGLTLRLPEAGYRTYVTAGGPSGLPGTAQIHFVAPGSSTDSFVVNVWNKAQWNAIRTEENFVHQNTTSLGEGTYLGENFTWIYSYQVFSGAAQAQQALSGAVFY
jgi:hypothetical protein